MNNTDDALLFLINTLIGLYAAILLIRVMLIWVRADFYNPIAQFVWQITRAPMDALKFIPKWRRLELGAILLAWVLVLINVQLVVMILGLKASIPALLAASVMNVLALTINVYTFSILIQALMSWINQGAHNPASSLLWSINEPLLRPVRQYLPPIGGMDLSPLFVILGLQVVRRLLPIPLPLY